MTEIEKMMGAIGVAIESTQKVLDKLRTTQTLTGPEKKKARSQWERTTAEKRAAAWDHFARRLGQVHSDVTTATEARQWAHR